MWGIRAEAVRIGVMVKIVGESGVKAAAKMW